MACCYACRNSSFKPPAKIRAPLRQTLLGASLKGELCILPPSISLPTTELITQKELSFATPFITELSDELLDEIFTYALDGKQLWRARFYQTALILSMVSKRFHRIVQPLMYRTVNLMGHSLVRPCSAVKQLHRTINENRVVGSMVRTLLVHLRFPLSAPEAEFIIGTELLDFLPNVESFSLHGGYDHSSTWPMIRNAVTKWPRIKHIQLSREDWTLLMPPVCELIIAAPSLRTLNLHGISAVSPRNKTRQPIWVKSGKDVERSSSITDLVINDFGDKPESLLTLLKLIGALEHFEFGKIHSNPSRWCLDMFQWLLADHQATLKSIEIGSLTGEFTSINFLGFPSLEVLTLSYWVYRETPEVAAATLLAPKLHTFIWDFRIIDQHSESWEDFDKEQKEWLLKFSKLAAANKSALRRIEIMFYPDLPDGIETKEALAEIVTPWDLMEEAKDKMKPLGIELDWNKCWSREEHLQRLEAEEKFREESLQNREDNGSLHELSDLEESWA